MKNISKNNDEKEKDNIIKYKKLNNFRRIRRGSNYNAYHRKNLGSIPSKIDNFIFKLPEQSKTNLTSILQPIMLQDENLCFRRDIFKYDHNSWKNFGSGNSIELKGNSVQFSVNNTLKNLRKNKSEYDLTNLESFKTLYSNTNNSTAQTNNKGNKEKDKINDEKEDKNSVMNLNKDKMNKKKALMNKFTKEDRYNNVYYKREILDKYYPGPGDYEINEFIFNNQKNPLRYNSLFKCKSSFPLIELKNTMYNIGPGSYNIFNEKETKGGTFSKLEKPDIILGKNNIKESTNIGPGYLDLPGGIKIHNKDKLNYYFLKEPNKEEKLELKYGIERDERNINKDVNKFGEFNVIPRWSNKEKTKSFNNDWINKNLEKKMIEEKSKGNIVDLNENGNNEKEEITKQDVYYWAKMANEQMKQTKENAKKRKGAYTFSKIPKLIMENNHVPGPGYYDPKKVLNGKILKKEFNSNLDMIWI